jgi:outer membrane protein, multidrug efflux system
MKLFLRTQRVTYRRLLPVLFLLAAASCKTPLPAGKQSSLVLPQQFTAAKDTAGAQAISKALVFPDTALVQLIDVAVKQNPDVLIAVQRIEAARSYLRLRKGALFPTVSVSAEASGTKYGDYTMEGVGNYDTNLSGNIDENQNAPVPFTPGYFLGLRSSWEIDLWGKLRQQKKSAYKTMLATEQGKNLVITTLVAEVASRYYELKALDAELEIIKRNVVLQDSAVQIAVVQKAAGRSTELGVQQFKAQLIRTRSLQLRTEQEIFRAEHELNFLAGRFPQAVPRSAGFLQDSLPHGYLPGLPSAVLERRPDLQQAALELEASGADVAAAKAALLPSLSIAPFVGYNAFNSALLFNPGSLAYGVAGGLVGPLLNRSALKGSILRAEAEKKQALHRYEKAVLGAFRELDVTLSNIDKLEQVFFLNMEEAGMLADAVVTSNELYRAGYASYLEVITAQRNALEAAINAIETRKNSYYALINLYRAAGGGW